MYKQTETALKNVMLGFGTGSIYDYGCYLTSLCNGLNKKGYAFTPTSLNDLLKSKNAFNGKFNNYIDVANLNKYFPEIFGTFQQIEPWNDTPTTQELLKDNLVVVCKVDAKVIGGSGTHFVLLTGIKDGVAVIHDPWKGVEEKITVRWSNFGNILGIRIFTVKPYVKPVDTSVEKLPKDSVLRDIYTFLCGGYSDGEIDWRMNSGKNLVEIGTDICNGDGRFKEKWIPKPTVINVPQPPQVVYVDKPVYLPDDRMVELKKIKDSKGWWWVKYAEFLKIIN